MARPLPPKKVPFRESVKSIKYIPRFFKQIRDASPSLFYGNIILRLFQALIPVLTLWIGKLIIDEVIFLKDNPDQSFNTLLYYIMLELILVMFSDVFNNFVALSDGLLGDKYSIDSSVKLIKKTSELELSQLENSEVYDKLDRARQQTTNRVSLMSNILSLFQDVITIFSMIGALVTFEPWLVLLLLISVIPSIINEIKFSGTSYSLARSWTQERREMDYMRYIGASDVTAKEVKLFGLADYFAGRFKELADRYFLANRALAVSRTIWSFIFNFFGNIAYYGAYILIIYRTIEGIISIGDLTFLSGTFRSLKNRLSTIFSRFTSITESSLFLQDYFDFLDLNTDKEDPAEWRKYKPFPAEIKTGFEFRNVGFIYPGGTKYVVRNLNFTLKAGEKLALVGENGAGKTTLVKLLLRFYDPTEGDIFLDGINVKELERSEYQQMFGVIFQDFFKYDLSFRENVAVGNISELDNDTKLSDALEKSLADAVMQDFPNGMDQLLGKKFKNGKELSGGQWQKIALARAYMKEAKVLVLDEPTSALDARSEYEAFQRFIGLTKGKTSVIISHRFSTVRMADRILVLKNGSIEEIGTHEELLKNEGLYEELFNLQAAGYQ